MASAAAPGGPHGTTVQPVAPAPAAASGVEGAKKLAAYAAVDRHIRAEHKVIGIGSGSTVPYVIDRIKEQGAEANKGRLFIPTGFQSKELIINAGLALGDIDITPRIDVTIDGADEVDSSLNSIKGGGACQLREKVLAEASETWVVVADYRKNSQTLGDKWHQGIPIEVVPFAYAPVLLALAALGSPARSDPAIANGTKLALRMGKAKAGPVVSDNGNFIIDAPFSKELMSRPKELLQKIKMITGVVEVGLFTDMCKAAYFGNEDGSVTIKREGGQEETVAP